ncbi:MAG: hypothetical protein WCP39_02035 [Chlamydiota bacterium]
MFYNRLQHISPPSERDAGIECRYMQAVDLGCRSGVQYYLHICESAL